MVTDGSCICGEHSIAHRVVEALHSTPENIVTLCVNSTSIKHIFLIKKQSGKKRGEMCIIYKATS